LPLALGAFGVTLPGICVTPSRISQAGSSFMRGGEAVSVVTTWE